MKSRYWFLLSLMLFIAAALVWKQAEQRRVHAVKQQVPARPSEAAAQPHVSSAKGSPVAPGKVSVEKVLSSQPTNAVQTNAAKALYPNRLSNTSQNVGQLARNNHAVLLRNALIDTTGSAIKIPEHLRSKGDPGSYIVQARGAIDEVFRSDLRSAKAEIISYVPNNAYLVKLNSGGAEKLSGSKSVQSVMRYEPYYKLDTELLDLAVKSEELPLDKFLRVTLFPGQVEGAVTALKGHASIIDQDLKSSPFGPELIVSTADLVALANLPQVQEIEPFYQREKLNDLTRVRVGISPDTTSAINYLDLSGSNVLVNVNDTTIDTNHVDLAPRVSIGLGDGTDEDGHGTHVAGIIASSGANGPSGSALEEVGSLPNANFRGKAPNSSILSFDIFAGFSDAELQQAAARTNYVELNKQSPLISNNSWGYGTRNYSSASASYDAAVRDALPGSSGSQPIAFVFAAGNNGGGNNEGQGGSVGSVVSPATAKNVITVGALESFRNITNDVYNCEGITNQEFFGFTDSSNQVASFSSRGNVGVSQEGTFGRLKPDVVAPGTFIASTKSGQFDEESYYSPLRVDNRVRPNLFIDPFGTNHYSAFLFDEACGNGAALSLTIEANVTSPVSTNPLPLLIYAATTPVPSANGANLIGTNIVTINRGDARFPLNGNVYFDIVNSNDVEVTFNLRTSIVLSNDFGNYFQVLSNLNSKLGPNYMFESGTSMAAPAVSGMLALMQEFFEQRFQITNSPAMMKALLINGSRAVGPGYGYEKGTSLNIQGWGLPDLRQILPTNGTPATWPIQLFDQSTNFALATGEQHDRVLTMTDTNSPLRVTLVWTDPPGNPAVGVKLVNDLDLMVTEVLTGDEFNTNGVTNIYFGNNFTGGEFSQAIQKGTNSLTDFDSVRDSVNNVENVFINGPLGAQYTVSVVAHRVNVNAVTGHTNGVVQDYALVVSSGDLTEVSPFTTTTNVVAANTNAFVTVVTNGVPLFNQRVGANSPLQQVMTNDLVMGTNTQWNFYVLNNPSNFTNIAFLTFLPPNLSGATNTAPGSRRILEADIDMYVSTDPTLTNLNQSAIAAADKSRHRGGQEQIIYTNRNDSVFYVGIKSEDQRAAEFSFFAVASETPFSDEDENGNLILHGVGVSPSTPKLIPDGTAENPGGVPIFAFATKPIKVSRVIVTNQFSHERLGDLINELTHNNIGVALHNHRLPQPGVPTPPESGTFFGIYDDSGLNPDPNSRPSAGPGSLNDYISEEGVGVWMLSMEDNTSGSTGQVERLDIFLEKSLETNSLSDGVGFTISTTKIPAGESRGLNFIVPLNTTNMIISIAPKEGSIDTVVRRGLLAPKHNPGGGAPYVDVGKLINPPGGNLTVGLTNVPPLKPGRYTLRLYNDNGFPVTISGLVRFEFDLSARSFQTFLSSGITPILDDGVAKSTVNVNRGERVVDVEVGLRIDHPRASDLVLHLVSPEGTRILLAENRGGLSTNGYGSSLLTTNVATATSNGGADPDTNSIPIAANSGIVNIDYDFFDQPDQLQVMYDGQLIYDTGLISGAGTLSIPFGPGISTNLVIVMNGDGNPNSGTAWNYTATISSGQLIYATFSENTNLALVPIKFAVPPFATNVPGSNIVSLMSSSFEPPTAVGSYSNPQIVDGWDVDTNGPVAVENAPGVAYNGTNYLNLAGGKIRRTLPTDAGKLYNLKFAYKRGTASSLGGARIAIGDVFTNDFIGTAGWIPYSQSFGGKSGGNTLELEGILPDMLFDGFQLTEGGDPNYFLPEESLGTLIGENARGAWSLEVWDNRAGQPVPGGSIVSWQLHLTFTSTNATATILTNGVQTTGTVNGNQITYFIVDVPVNATHATNTLVSLGGPLNLLFNQNALPVGNPRFGDYTFLASTAGGVYDLNTLIGPPYLQPGRRYYLGVQNVNRTQTNQFTLQVDFDNTNNLVEVTPLTNGIPLSTNLPLNRSIQYYQYDVSSGATQVRFEILNPSDDVDLVVRRGLLPSPNNYDFNSINGSTNNELITVDSGSVPPLTPGRYYLGVYGFFPTTNIDYTVRVTEVGGPPTLPPGTIIGLPTVTTNGVTLDAVTIPGDTYNLEVSTDLITWTVVQTITATGNVTTFTDNTPPATQTSRFYRVVPGP